MTTRPHPLLLLLFLIFAASLEAQVRCDDSGTTASARACGAQRLRKAEQDMARYLDAARQEVRDSASVDSAQRAWARYRELACRSEAAVYEGGSIQPVVGLACLIRITEQRSRELWDGYLAQTDIPAPVTDRRRRP